MQKGSIVCSDRLRAYRDNLGKMGYKWAGVDHKSGEFIRHDPIYTPTNKKKLLPVSSNMIDGLWGPLKEFFHQHRGVPHQRYPLLAAEFEWRHNAQGSDLFRRLFRPVPGPDSHLQNRILTRRHRSPTVPTEPETYFFVFPDLKIGGGGSLVLPQVAH